MHVGAMAQLWVFWQSDRKIGGSLRNGSEQSHAHLAEELAAARLGRPRLPELQTPQAAVAHASSCASSFGVMILEIASGSPEGRRHLPCKTRLACKSQERTIQTPLTVVLLGLRAWALEPNPTTLLAAWPLGHLRHLSGPVS